MHATRYKLPVNQEAIAFLAKAAPLHTPEWDAWSAGTHTPNLAGRWLVTASMQGRGKYYGEMQVERTGDEFNTSVHLTSVRDGSTITRSGRGVGLWSVRLARTFPGRLLKPASFRSRRSEYSEAREVLWMAPDQSTARGPLVLGTVSGIRLRREVAAAVVRIQR